MNTSRVDTHDVPAFHTILPGKGVKAPAMAAVFAQLGAMSRVGGTSVQRYCVVDDGLSATHTTAAKPASHC
ncbi:MAG: hypothetical protein RBU37_03145 [Myxococcota bacterium]|nr:hypothetical protein [Myxococcota bacterium]